MDINADERRNVRTMLRWVGSFMAWPGLSIAVVFLLDLEGHVGHFVLTLMFGVIGLVVLATSSKLAKRFYPPEEVHTL